MLIAIIIGLVMVSTVGTWLALRVKKSRLEYLRKSIGTLINLQTELLGRIQNFLGSREKDRSSSGAIMQRSKELVEEAKDLLSQAQSNSQIGTSATFISLRESLTDIEENLSSAFRSYEKQVADFNSTIDMLPANLLAKILRYQKEPQLN